MEGICTQRFSEHRDDDGDHYIERRDEQMVGRQSGAHPGENFDDKWNRETGSTWRLRRWLGQLKREQVFDEAGRHSAPELGAIDTDNRQGPEATGDITAGRDAMAGALSKPRRSGSRVRPVPLALTR